jgi:tetratricopeptide (TPR) repeat protein
MAETSAAGGGAAASIRIERGTPDSAPDSRLARAYNAAQAQRPAEAVRDWQRVLRERPQDPDALGGLAAVALTEGRTQEALALYQRLLERDPQDVTAQAALVQLASMDPVQGESRIKLLLQQQPEAAHLHFALGNFYARQERWAEAQQAYFKAMSADKTQPDYLYNLAVSLDQLGQARAAQGFYAQALEQASHRPAQFPRAAAQTRLGELGAASAAAP